MNGLGTGVEASFLLFYSDLHNPPRGHSQDNNSSIKRGTKRGRGPCSTALNRTTGDNRSGAIYRNDKR
jgi:hypothetical protein